MLSAGFFQETSLRASNRKPLALHVPQPQQRPGDEPDFSGVAVPPAGMVARPEITVRSSQITDLAYSLIRVLDNDGNAVGPWDPRLDPELLVRGLRSMVLTRSFDE